MSEPRKLVFDDSNEKSGMNKQEKQISATPDNDTPKKLSFDDVAQIITKKIEAKKPGALDFKEIDAKKEAESEVREMKERMVRDFYYFNNKASREINPRPLFENPNAPLIKKAMQYVESNFQTLKADMHRVEAQISQLIPLSVGTVLLWGAAALEQESQLALSVAKQVKDVFEIQCTSLCEKILNAIKGTVNHSFFDKLFKEKDDISQLKGALAAAREELKHALPRIEQFISDTIESETRLLIQLSSLAAVREVTGQPSDSSLDRAVTDRRTILQQAATQAKLANLQLIETKKNIIDQLTRVEQLVNVTLPAYELAKVNKQSNGATW